MAAGTIPERNARSCVVTGRRRKDGSEAMAEGKRALRLAFKRIEREVPGWLASAMRWLRHPSSRWLRLPAGVLLMLGGVFAVLPVLGIWMLPLGLMLLAADIPFLRKPMARFAMWSVGLWERLRARLRRRSGEP